MKNFRIIVIALGTITVTATIAIGFVFGTMWSVCAASVGLVALLFLIAYVQLKTLQTVNQRLAGVQRQNERLQSILVSAGNSSQLNTSGEEASLLKGLHRASEELVLASRSVTVPQAHFDQLLRTISANSLRTELALEEAIEHIRELHDGAVYAAGSSERTNRETT